MDGGFNTNGAPRRILWALNRNRGGRSSGGGLRRVFRNFISFVGRIGRQRSSLSSSSSSLCSSSETETISRNQSQSASVMARYMRRRNRALVF